MCATGEAPEIFEKHKKGHCFSTHSNAPTPTISETKDPFEVPAIVTVNADCLIRSEPSPSGERISSYKRGDSTIILEISKDWGRTNKGWVLKLADSGDYYG